MTDAIPHPTSPAFIWPGAVASLFVVTAESAHACSGCTPLVRAYLFDGGDFLLNLALVLLPIIAVVGVASAVAAFGEDP